MRRSGLTRWCGLVASAVVLCACGQRCWAAEGSSSPQGIKVLVVTGGHGYNEQEFPKIFAGYDDIAATILKQNTGGEAFDNVENWTYDVIVLYNFNQQLNGPQQANFLKLLNKGVGLIVLHHAMAAYPDWPEFRNVAGGKFYLKPNPTEGVTQQSGVKFGVELKVQIADAQHPVTKGLKGFTIHEEAYNHYWLDPQAHALLTTDDPGSDKVIGWAKSYGKARVFGLELGHDEQAWSNPGFRAVIAQAIRWVAGK